MGKPAARAAIDEPVAVKIMQEDRVARSCPSRQGCAVEIRDGERRYVILTDRRGLLNAQEILEDGSLGEPLVDDEFDALHHAFPWDA